MKNNISTIKSEVERIISNSSFKIENVSKNKFEIKLSKHIKISIIEDKSGIKIKNSQVIFKNNDLNFAIKDIKALISSYKFIFQA